MKTKEELNRLKEECAEMRKKLAELTEDELKEVTGGDGAYEHREVFDYLHYSDRHEGTIHIPR